MTVRRSSAFPTAVLLVPYWVDIYFIFFARTLDLLESLQKIGIPLNRLIISSELLVEHRSSFIMKLYLAIVATLVTFVASADAEYSKEVSLALQLDDVTCGGSHCLLEVDNSILPQPIFFRFLSDVDFGLSRRAGCHLLALSCWKQSRRRQPPWPRS
jgi:hypothetical protein